MWEGGGGSFGWVGVTLYMTVGLRTLVLKYVSEGRGLGVVQKTPEELL